MLPATSFAQPSARMRPVRAFSPPAPAAKIEATNRTCMGLRSYVNLAVGWLSLAYVWLCAMYSLRSEHARRCEGRQQRAAREQGAGLCACAPEP